MPITEITKDYFSGGRNLTEDPDSKRELADVIIELQQASNSNESAVGAHAARHITGGGDTIADAVAGGAAGLMTGADKTKLDGIEALADVTDATNVEGAGALMNPMTAQGDLVVAGAGAVTTALPLGTPGQVLSIPAIPGTDPAWDDAGNAAFVATEAVPGTIWLAPPGPPVTIQDAIDRMAAQLAAVGLVPIP